jgi:peptidoglycan hydrolase CwlO-like protein
MSRTGSLVARRAAPVLAVLLLGSLLAIGPVRADTASKLAAAKRQLAGLISKIAGEQQQINGLESEASAIAAKISDVQARIAQTQNQIDKTRAAMAVASRQLTAKQQQLDARARATFEAGTSTSLEFILGATSLQDLSDRLEIVSRASQTDKDLINQIVERKNQLHIQQVQLDALETRLLATQSDLQTQEHALQAKLATAQSILNGLNKDKADALKLVNKLKKERAAELAALQAALGGGNHGGGSISGVFHVCPVDQPRGYSDDFGAPRYSGGYHPHAGNDIFAPLGTPIRAPFSGSASVASNGLGGLSVIVTGALGYTYNAHLSRFGTLGSVSVGTIVGYVGNTGDAQGGPTHDHFEWHPNTIPGNLWKSPYGYTVIGDAIDPYPYLNSVC